MDDKNAPSKLSDNKEVKGEIDFPGDWTVFAPIPAEAPDLSGQELTIVPASIRLGEETLPAEQVRPIRNQYDFGTYFGSPPYKYNSAAYIFIPLESDREQEVTLGLGADWFLKAWVNGKPVLDTMAEGNGSWPPSVNDHLVDVRLNPGRNVLAVRFHNGAGSALVAIGGPSELRQGDFSSIASSNAEKKKVKKKNISEQYPPDPEAPIRWDQPKSFDPDIPGLGLSPMGEAEHREWYQALPSSAPVEEGGSGEYESLRHGTWNHDIKIAVFNNHVIVSWNNHAADEIGPGTRVLAYAGKILNSRGDVDWNASENFVELAPPPVPVRRRATCCHDPHIARCIRSMGRLQLIGGRLFFCGRLKAIHGTITDTDFGAWPNAGNGVLPAPEHFYFKLPDGVIRPGGAARWDIGLEFYQEWAIKDGRLQSVSPVYLENEIPRELQLTHELSLPLEPLLPPYCDAPLLADAPSDIQDLIANGERKGFKRPLRYRPGTSMLAADGRQGALAHSAQFRRPDGSWVAVREYLRPEQEPFYHAAEKPDEASYYPPARRTNLYGAANPASGELPDGSAFIVGNSPNRHNMYITVSNDGRLFDKTWLLYHGKLENPVPGKVKGSGGPQYFEPVVIGENLWLVYSIGKQNIGVTRVPLRVLQS